jgi:hypothetical protein
MPGIPFISLLIIYLGPLLVVPLVGASLLFVALRLAQVADLTYGQCCRAYLAAVGSQLACNIALNAAFALDQRTSGELLAITLAVACAAQLLVIGALLRQFTARPLAAEGAAVLVTNLVAAAPIYLLVMA